MSKIGGPKPCPQCESRGQNPRMVIRFLMLSDPDGPFWYACDLCGYTASIQDTPHLAAKAWNTENREPKEGQPVKEVFETLPE